MRSLGIFAVAMTLAALAGCGNATAPSTTPAAEGQAVAPDRYLADTVEAAESVTAFSAALATLPSPATPEGLKAIAPQLELPLERARLVAQRLTAERLADRRLDEQRAQRAAGFDAALAAMQRVRDAAAAGDAATTKTAADELTQALTALRATTAE
jgi:predicted small lipoprotein YifL